MRECLSLCAWRGGERECKRESDGVEFPQKKKNEVRGEEGKKLTPQPLVLVSPTGSFFPLHSLSLSLCFFQGAVKHRLACPLGAHAGAERQRVERLLGERERERRRERTISSIICPRTSLLAPPSTPPFKMERALSSLRSSHSSANLAAAAAPQPAR